jgi:diadenosine tetraphosphate (Ap4A) HIT family hydrolase
MNWKDDRLGAALRGENPTVLHRMKSGFAVLADTQFLPGYCILLAYPKAKSLNDLGTVPRLLFLREMSIVGDAILDICKPLRINYEILGNTDAYLHAHIIPRYDWEEDELRKQPVWLYPAEYRTSPEFQFSEEKHGELKQRLSDKLKEYVKP